MKSPRPLVGILTLFFACSGPDTLGVAGIHLVVHNLSGMTLHQYHLVLSHEGSAVSLDRDTFPREVGAPLNDAESMNLLLRGAPAGAVVQITVEGLQDGHVVVRGEAVSSGLILGSFINAKVDVLALQEIDGGVTDGPAGDGPLLDGASASDGGLSDGPSDGPAVASDGPI